MDDSLITKYRPGSLKQMVGQAHLMSSVRDVVDKRRAHAFLLVGPSGTGKTTLARIIAHMLGADEQTIMNGEHDAATFNGVDAMRQITDGLRYKPLGGSPIKITLIDECQRLSSAAWDSILKSVEEPSEWVYWFFCTTEPGKVPATLKTRCVTYQLKEVDTADIIDLLTWVAKEEKMDCDQSVIDLCAKEAKGSPRQGLAYLAVCATAKTKKDALELMSSAEGSTEAIDLCRALMDNSPWTKCVDIISKLKETNPESIRQVVRAYFTKVLMGGTDTKKALYVCNVLDTFGKPFNTSDGITPVLLAVALLKIPQN
jgi:DNA polymerase-3 subunit gamma/tau